LHPVPETGPDGWMTLTKYIDEAPSNWDEADVKQLLNVAEAQMTRTLNELNLRGLVIRKRRGIGLVPRPGQEIARESLDETILRMHEALEKLNQGKGPRLPYCAFNGGTDCWVDVGNKRVGVRVLQAYLGISADDTLHIGDQFLNTGNDHAARDVSPCVWIISPQETTYILKSILRLAGVNLTSTGQKDESDSDGEVATSAEKKDVAINFQELERRTEAAKRMDVYTGDML
jgi:IMP and pyridine-specific 5'-nucleotidase